MPCPNLMNLSRGLNPPKTSFHSRQKLKLKNWIQFLVEPSIFERPLKFKPPLKFIKFGLRFTFYFAQYLKDICTEFSVLDNHSKI